VWGGVDANDNDPDGGGAVYQTAESAWKPMAQAGQPSYRSTFTGVWTGKELIVWGGEGSDLSGTGGAYDLEHDAWRPLATVGAPSPRHVQAAIWTGTEMIVWGGEAYVGVENSGKPIVGNTNTGALYDPVHDTWRPTSLDGAPEPRKEHFAVWTGARMLVMGGEVLVGPEDALVGGLYDPVTDRWQSTTTKGAPPFFFLTHFAAWDHANGRLLIVGEPPTSMKSIQVWAYTPPAP
jgi:hypothetical protein